MNSLLVRGGRLIDPATGFDRETDVLVLDGKIARIERGIAPPKDLRICDARNRVVAPGFVDLHVHLREPGHEYKEDIASGSRAAVAGGFTTLCCMPNTTPPNDCRAVTELISKRAREVGLARIRPIGAISKGLAGESLAEMAEMREAGIVAVSDDGRCVMNGELMRRALEYARTFGLPVVQHAEDTELSGGGVMNEGEVATRAGLRGQPGAAESSVVARDLELCSLTGARYHVAHVSTARSIALIRQAKAQGLPVTCEVTPHHLTLTDRICESYDTNTKCAPPLRSPEDVRALGDALLDGTIDAIATDHAPHSLVEKDLEFDHAAFGIIGLETALPLALKFGHEIGLSLMKALGLLTHGPARAFALDAEGIGSVAVGNWADLTVIDLARTFTVDVGSFRSKSRNSPFGGWSLTGKVTQTIVGGGVVYDEAGT